MIQGFVDAIAAGYLEDSIESDIESYGLSAYLESEDLERLDRLTEIEGENEDRTSRVTRLLEGSVGAISFELNYHQENSANDRDL